MKINVIIIFLFFICITVQAQSNSKIYENNIYVTPFAIIDDADGYSNVRGEKREIIGKIYDNQVFAVPSFEDETTDKYMSVLWNDNNLTRYSLDNEKHGYVHKTRIKYLKDLQLLKKEINGNAIRFENTKYEIKIKLGKFDINQYRMGLDENGNLCCIENYDIYGTDGILHENLIEIKEILIKLNGEENFILPEFLIGYFSPNIEAMFVAEGKNDTIFISMTNGDGAGGYGVVWTIKGNQIFVATFRDF